MSNRRATNSTCILVMLTALAVTDISSAAPAGTLQRTAPVAIRKPITVGTAVRRPAAVEGTVPASITAVITDSQALSHLKRNATATQQLAPLFEVPDFVGRIKSLSVHQQRRFCRKATKGHAGFITELSRDHAAALTRHGFVAESDSFFAQLIETHRGKGGRSGQDGNAATETPALTRPGSLVSAGALGRSTSTADLFRPFAIDPIVVQNVDRHAKAAAVWRKGLAPASGFRSYFTKLPTAQRNAYVSSTLTDDEHLQMILSNPAKAYVIAKGLPAGPKLPGVRTALPVKPSETLTKPSLPIKPAATPTKPTLPTRPSLPIKPADATPTKPTLPTRPTLPIKPAATPTKPTLPTKPSLPVKPAATRPATPAIVKPVATKPATPAVVKPAATRPATPAVVKPAATRPATPAVVKPVATKPATPAVVKPVATKPATPAVVKPAATPTTKLRIR